MVKDPDSVELGSFRFCQMIAKREARGVEGGALSRARSIVTMPDVRRYREEILRIGNRSRGLGK